MLHTALGGAGFLLPGVTAGAPGAAYSALVVRTLEVCDRLTRVPLVVRAAAIGAGVGALACSRASYGPRSPASSWSWR
ncbi:hypothetical protein GCM10010343_22510 [Streptomyces avidinii]|uniref:Uncharacterized protein n=1 Tax=Streptomyces avidinii TaxID=1895 RepID=A0ABS4L590_STRAV|nr:hypothetical protein [Streptomyces avidinii]GGY96431.1 hypothetical protein GCM10010343_22510 [Streptomyces avidinii]